MRHIDLEACRTFVQANRIIAERFREKAGEALVAMHMLEDPDAKQKLSQLASLAQERAALHEETANQQELDLGTACYCPVRRPAYVQ